MDHGSPHARKRGFDLRIALSRGLRIQKLRPHTTPVHLVPHATADLLAVVLVLIAPFRFNIVRSFSRRVSCA